MPKVKWPVEKSKKQEKCEPDASRYEFLETLKKVTIAPKLSQKRESPPDQV